MSEPVSEFTISLDQVKDYQFQVHFPKEVLDDLVLDEGPPLGAYAGPSPSMFLASAIGGCLSSSLLFCARKQRVEVGRLRARVTVQTVRNEDRRLRIGKRKRAALPDVCYVNWFQKSDGGDFLWPGFGENSRVLKWVFERCEGKAEAVETPIGYVPAPGALDLSGLML